MKVRIINWINTMEWDWCISRQRIFATPIPIWYCNNCNEIITASYDTLPIDPTITHPNCICKCGSDSFRGEYDVLDTWMDSSITSLNVGGWDTKHELKCPVQLRQQGHDIIRTWAFYTIVRSLALQNNIPWENIVINGMVLGSDGKKMSKSLGNTISPDEIIEKYGSDIFRQWAAIGGTMGSDIIFQWKDVISSSRFVQKIWNIYKFIMLNIEDFNLEEINNFNVNDFKNIDKWILMKLDDLIVSVTTFIEKTQYSEIFKEIRFFVWDILANNYIELIKERLYNIHNKKRKEAQYTLIIIQKNLCKLLAPFMPYLAEEIYYSIFKKSVHLEKWPRYKNIELQNLDIENINKEAEIIINIAKEIRKYKKSKGYPLNFELKKVEIYNLNKNNVDIEDLKGATKSNILIKENELFYEKVPSKINFNMNILGPLYKKETKKIVELISKIPITKLINNHNEILDYIIENGEKIIIPKNSIEILFDYQVNKEKIDIININEVSIVIPKN